MSSSSSSDQTQTLATYPIIPKSDLVVKEQLGVGTYGSVHKGIWKNGDKEVTVALKKVFMLEKEVDILSQVRHRNIIQFYGVSHANPDFYIVTEFAENGSLYEYLHNDCTEVTFDHIIKWAIQIAQGVHYLHYEAPATIIHRDLKSKNVVLGKNYVCKLCDFGTSKDLTHSYTEPTWGGTAAWMSPEIINQKEGITTATDIWSFGVCLWELVSREVPYKGLTEFKIYSIISQYGSRLAIPETCPTALANLLRDCWHVNPRERVDMKDILVVLQQMDQDYELRKECANFVEQKDDWRHEIQQQLRELEEMKMDLARQKEELERREKALRQRESSHRNFLQMLELMKYNNVVEWNEECVCAWIQHFLMGAIAEMTTENVDKLMTCVLQYEINGSRLLKVTERDLETLGIEPVGVRQAICAKIDELRITNVDYINFPSLQMSALWDARSKLEKANATFGCTIFLHVGTYHRRIMGASSSAYRFKVFLDSDWEQDDSVDSIPPAIHDSATVIKEVFVTITAANGFVLLDTTRCVCPPFGYLEWVDVDLEDMRESGSLPLSVTVAINYTDQVVQPRSTCLNFSLASFDGVSTLTQKQVPLRVRMMPTETSLSRISSTLFSGDKSPSTNNLQGVWRRRASSFGTKTTAPPEPRLEVLQTGQKSTVWSDIAAGISRVKSPPRHSKSTPNGDASNVFTPPPLPPSTSYRLQASTADANGRTRSTAISIPPRRPRKTSETDVLGNRTPEARTGFYLSSNSPSESPIQLTPQEQRMNPLAVANGLSGRSSTVREPVGSCNNTYRSCEQRSSAPSTGSPTPASGSTPNKKNRRRFRKPQNKKTPSTSDPLPNGPSGDASSQTNEVLLGKNSQNVYGGYNKWRWKV